VRLIDIEGRQVGVLPIEEAQDRAREVGLDLVEVAPQADPPVCKIMDFGKFRYEQTKRGREAKKAQKITEVKVVRLRPKTDKYHIGFKLRQARKFLQKGAKVKLQVMFRGREITHPELGRELLRMAAEELADVAVIEQDARLEGRNMFLMLSPR
jgi:translation initiation factor IF-3